MRWLLRQLFLKAYQACLDIIVGVVQALSLRYAMDVGTLDQEVTTQLAWYRIHVQTWWQGLPFYRYPEIERQIRGRRLLRDALCPV